MGYYFCNNRFVEDKDATISVNDLGLMRSFGVFEYVRSYAGEFFHLDDHLKRFFASAKFLDLTVPYGMDEMASLCKQLLEKNELLDAGLRFVLTGGVSENLFLPEGKSSLCMLMEPLSTPHGFLKLKTSAYARQMPLIKSLNYMPAILGFQMAKGLGFDAPLFLNDKGHILEGAKENFFAVKGNRLITPKEGVLRGITREIVMNFSPYEVEERAILYDELNTFDEVFLTSTVREIAPISKIDHVTFSNFEKTNELIALYGQGVPGKTKV